MECGRIVIRSGGRSSALTSAIATCRRWHVVRPTFHSRSLALSHWRGRGAGSASASPSGGAHSSGPVASDAIWCPDVLYVVRHGRTSVNARGLLLGRADPPL